MFEFFYNFSFIFVGKKCFTLCKTSPYTYAQSHDYSTLHFRFRWNCTNSPTRYFAILSDITKIFRFSECKIASAIFHQFSLQLQYKFKVDWVGFPARKPAKLVSLCLNPQPLAVLSAKLSRSWASRACKASVFGSVEIS